MIIIQIKDNESIEKALRRYKRKVQDTNLHKQVRDRQFFEKDSVKKRNTLLKAAYRERKKRETENE
ncbi:MAG: 30S ribosomal protein S21 [Microscillaceae bacterium]|nr:30S ribosomal protein S21 [Microscillaceae bacterium]